MKFIDISSNNNLSLYDLQKMKQAGIDSVYIKATEGRTYTNTLINKQYNNAVQVFGVNNIGFYHFARLNNPALEIQHFKSVISNYKYGLLPCLDIEDYNIPDKNGFIKAFDNAFGGKDNILVYTFISYYHSYINVYNHKMWIADYRGCENCPFSIRDNILYAWQYTDKYYNGCTDCSICYKKPTLNCKPSNQDIGVNTSVKKTSSVRSIMVNAVVVLKNDIFFARDCNGNIEKGHYLSQGDKIQVQDVSYSKQLVKVLYPTPNGYRQAYIKNVTSGIKYTGRLWRNGSTSEVVYDNDKKTVIGSLSPYETAHVLSEGNGWYNIVYNTKKGINTKSGWVRYHG